MWSNQSGHPKLKPFSVWPYYDFHDVSLSWGVYLVLTFAVYLKMSAMILIDGSGG